MNICCFISTFGNSDILEKYREESCKRIVAAALRSCRGSKTNVVYLLKGENKR